MADCSCFAGIGHLRTISTLRFGCSAQPEFIVQTHRQRGNVLIADDRIEPQETPCDDDRHTNTKKPQK
jgi:hypothetical protein